MNNRYFLLEGKYLLDCQLRLIESDENKKISFNNNETRLITKLFNHHGECVSRKQLFEFAWDKRVVVDNSLNVAIASIRRKLKQFPGLEDKIITISGEGYQWIGDVELIEQHPFRNIEKPGIRIRTNLEPCFITRGILLVTCLLGLSGALYSLLSLANLL